MEDASAQCDVFFETTDRLNNSAFSNETDARGRIGEFWEGRPVNICLL